jgi:hypothetical protein
MLNSLTALSLALLVTVAVLWVFSYFPDLKFGSRDGRLLVFIINRPNGISEYAPTGDGMPPWDWGTLGFARTAGAIGTVTWEVVGVPWVVVALPFAALPAARASAWIRRRNRTARNACPSCGYDLRATPDRCPECGAVTMPAGAA